MKTVIVPKGECPLDTLAELGEEIRNSWIFIHESVIKDLETRVNESKGDFIKKFTNNATWCFWPGTKKYPSTSIVWVMDVETGWATVIEVIASDIAFKQRPSKPEEVYFFKSE